MNPIRTEIFRCYLAANAPEVPDWFEHVPPEIDYPPMPDFRTLDPTHQKEARQWQQDPCWDLPEELQWFGEKVSAHRAGRDRWNRANSLTRLVQWRWAYAGAMLAGEVRS